MKIHFCCDMDGWILERTARLLMEHIPGSTIGESVSAEADVNVYFPYYRLREKGPSVDIALFTHLEEASDVNIAKVRAWHYAIGEADWCLGMSARTLAHLPAYKSSLLDLPTDPSFKLDKPITFGVCGRDYASGRKNMDWLRTLSTIVGSKWLFTNGSIRQEAMPGFYDAIDYLVVLSTNEGGPMPVKEAIARHVPVIAPDVGWAWEYPVIRYRGYEELVRIVQKLVPKFDAFASARELMSACWRFKDAA